MSEDLKALVNDLRQNQTIPIPCWPSAHWADHAALVGREALDLRALAHLRAHAAWRELVPDESSDAKQYFDARALEQFVTDSGGTARHAKTAVARLLAAATQDVPAARRRRLEARAAVVLRRLGVAAPATSALSLVKDDAHGADTPAALRGVRRDASAKLVRLSRAEPAINLKAYLPLLKCATILLAEDLQSQARASAGLAATMLVDSLEQLCAADDSFGGAFLADAREWASQARKALVKREVVMPGPALGRHHAVVPAAGSALSARPTAAQRETWAADPSALAQAQALHFLRILHAELMLSCPEKPGKPADDFYATILDLVEDLAAHPRIGAVAAQLRQALPQLWLFGGDDRCDESNPDALNPRAFEVRPASMPFESALSPPLRAAFQAAAGAARAIAVALTDPVFVRSRASGGGRFRTFSYLANKFRTQRRGFAEATGDTRAVEWTQLGSLMKLYAEDGYVERAQEILDEWAEIDDAQDDGSDA